MVKVIKLFSWFKSHWKLSLGVAIILVVVFAGIQGVRADKWHNKHLRLEGKLEEQKADQDKRYEEAAKKDGERAVAEAAEKQVRKDLEARIQKFQKDTVVGKRALRKEKEKTAVFPPTELVAEINQRIGDESSLTGAGLFLFTRLGANNTLDRFKDGEFYLSEYNKFQGVITDHKAEVESFNMSISKLTESVADNLEGWDDCRETLATAIASKEAQEKAFKASMAWGKVKAFVGGGLFVFVIDKIFGIF